METNESKAACLLIRVESAMRDAADALDAVGSDEAILHAKEMRDAAKVIQRLEIELWRIHEAEAG